MARAPRRITLRLPPKYRDLYSTFDALLRYFDEIDRDLSGTITITESQISDLGDYLEFVQAGDIDSEAATEGFVLTADGSGGAAWEESAGGDENPAPTITTLTPDTKEEGDPAFTLTVTGTGFVHWSLVLWDGAVLPTTYVSSTELQADVSADDIDTAGDVDVTVISPLPGGGESAASTFSVTGVLWTPAEITTSLWLDASDDTTITLASGDVSQWNDKSGNDWDVTEGTASNRPALIESELNSMDVVRFDGTDDRLSTAAAASIFRNRTYGWACAVVKRNDPGGSVFAVPRGTTNNGVRFGMFAGTSVGGRRLDGDSFGSHAADNPVAEDVWAVVYSALDWANRTALIHVDGESEGETTGLWSGGGSTSDTDSLGPLGVGASFTAGGNAAESFASADLAELVVGNTEPSAADIDRLFGYLAWKWGLEANLPVGHPYESGPPELP